MKYVSIDIETLGLDFECDILEFGAVLDDLANPLPLNLIQFIDKEGLPKKIIMDTAFHRLCFKNTAIEKLFNQIPGFKVEIVERKGCTI